MKTKRQNELMRLISENVITTQEELLEDLRNLGFNVTQATVSRDMRELKISKVSDPNGVLRYAASTPITVKKTPLNLNSALTDSIVKIDCAFNDIVIHTMPGLAGAIAVAIDALHIDQVLGCVAGDDTILLITRTEESASDICLRLREMLNHR